MSRPVHTYRGDLVAVEACGCRHDGRSYVATFKSDEDKLGMCDACKAAHAELHAQAAIDHNKHYPGALPAPRGEA